MPEGHEAAKHVAAVYALENFTLLGRDGRREETPELVQFVSPAIVHAAMNVVVRARFAPEEMDARIDAALAPYVEGGLNCWWMIAPNSSHPELLEAKLGERGFRVDHDAIGLTLEVATAPNRGAPAGTSAEMISGEELEEHLRIWRDGADPGEGYKNYFRFLAEKHGADLEVFLSRVDGKPAGVGIAHYVGRGAAANFLSGYVLPAFRKQGAYRALVDFRLQRLRARGVRHAVVLSKADTSAPILLRQGFEEAFAMRTLEWTHPKNRSR